MSNVVLNSGKSSDGNNEVGFAGEITLDDKHFKFFQSKIALLDEVEQFISAKVERPVKYHIGYDAVIYFDASANVDDVRTIWTGDGELTFDFFYGGENVTDKVGGYYTVLFPDDISDDILTNGYTNGTLVIEGDKTK